MLRERLQGAIGGVAQDTRKISAASASSGRNMQQQQRAGSVGYSNGIHNPAAEYYTPPVPPVPHFDGGISQRRDSRPPPDPYDSYR